MALRICYHGTSKESVEAILREGFKKGTYFAKHLEDAVHMGGPHVFGVVFDKTGLSSYWQFIPRDVIPPSRIVHYRVYLVREIACNEQLGEEVLQSNLAMGQDWCDLEDPA